MKAKSGAAECPNQTVPTATDSVLLDRKVGPTECAKKAKFRSSVPLPSWSDCVSRKHRRLCWRLRIPWLLVTFGTGKSCLCCMGVISYSSTIESEKRPGSWRPAVPVGSTNERPGPHHMTRAARENATARSLAKKIGARRGPSKPRFAVAPCDLRIYQDSRGLQGILVEIATRFPGIVSDSVSSRHRNKTLIGMLQLARG